jgi:hypothetical protein
MDKTICHLRKRLRHAKYLLLVFFIALSTISCKSQSEIRILFTGDILLSRNVITEYQTRRSSPWEDLKPLFQSADLVIGNLEGAVGKSEDQSFPRCDSPIFDIEKEHISLLREAGFSVITIENNHNSDPGTGSKEKTIDALRHRNITPVYYENSPWFFTIQDVVIALVTLNMIPGRDVSGNQMPSIEIRQKLRLARNLANIVIVSIHWGSELLDWPNREQRETAKWLIDNGADLIIGSHPHVIQEPEMIGGKPVFFSLGNHLFDQKYPETKKGLIVEIKISEGRYECNGIITHTKVNSFYPEVVENKSYFKDLSLNNHILRINDYTLKPFSISENNQNKIVIEAYQMNKKMWSSHSMSIISIEAGKLDGENEYLFTIEKHYSNLDGEISPRPYVYASDNYGLIDKWRGSALAWPLLDAIISPTDNTVLCALHRGDSFITLEKNLTNTRVAAYRWNGFGFTGISDPILCESCNKLFGD